MKKAIVMMMTVLAMVCIFALSASAYENEYFSIDVPSDFAVDESGYDRVEFTKGEEIGISVSLKENDYTDFYNMSASERTEWENNIRNTYSSAGVIEDFEIEFDGDGVSKSGMFYNFKYLNPENTDEYVYLEGVLYSEGGVLYHVFVVYTEEADYTLIGDILDTLEFTPGASDSPKGISYKSEDGIFTLTVPEGFTEKDASDPIDKMWMNDNNTYLISTLITQNILHVHFVGLTDAELEKKAREFAAGLGDDFTNVKSEATIVRGMEGLRLYGDFSNGIMEVYVFSTYDKMYAVYFFDTGEANADTYKSSVLNSLNISAEIYEGNNATEPVTTPVTEPSNQPSTQTVVPSSDAQTTVPAETVTQSEAEGDEKEKDNTTLYIVIGSVLVIAVAAIIAIVVVSNKKKSVVNNDPQYTQSYNPQQVQNPQNNYNNNGFNQNNNF